MLFEDDIVYQVIKAVVAVIIAGGMAISMTKFRYPLRRLVIVYGIYLVYAVLITALLLWFRDWVFLAQFVLLVITLPGVTITHLLSEGTLFQSIFNTVLQVDIAVILTISVTLLNQVFGWTKWQDIAVRLVIGALAIFVESRFLRKGYLRTTEILRTSWGTLMLIPISFMVLLFVFSIVPTYIAANPSGVVLFYMTALVMAFVCVIVFQSLAKSRILLSAQMEKENIERQLAIQKRFYEDKLGSEEKLRALRHDMRGHLNTLSALLEADQTAEAEDYLKRLIEHTRTWQEAAIHDEEEGGNAI